MFAFFGFEVLAFSQSTQLSRLLWNCCSIQNNLGFVLIQIENFTKL